MLARMVPGMPTWADGIVKARNGVATQQNDGDQTTVVGLWSAEDNAADRSGIATSVGPPVSNR
jgi:hypothetical protein